MPSVYLEDLLLHGNQLNGTFPAKEFANAINLREVSLCYNNISGGSLNAMCPLFHTGSLEYLGAIGGDTDVECGCCQECSAPSVR